jgi:mRNA capping enzyme, beta chain
MTKLVADFLYLKVVSRGDLGELASRGVEIEIEAKLGQLIDKDTNERYSLPVISECILAENARLGFRSSMTEVRWSLIPQAFLDALLTITTVATSKLERFSECSSYWDPPSKPQPDHAESENRLPSPSW